METRPDWRWDGGEFLDCDCRQLTVEIQYATCRQATGLLAHHLRGPGQEILRPEHGRLGGRMVQDWEVSIYHVFSNENVVDETLPAIRCPGSKSVFYQSLTKFADGVDKQVKIGVLAAMIRDGNADRKVTSNPGAGSYGSAAFLELTEYLVIQFVERLLVVSCRAEPETNDVQRDRSEALHVGRFFNDARQVTGLLDVLLNEAAIGSNAMDLKRHPDLQGFEAAREVESKIGEDHWFCQNASASRRQVGRCHGEGGSMALGVAYQRTPGFKGEVQPLVEIDAQGVCQLQATYQSARGLADRRPCAKGPIYMKPQTLVATDFRQPPGDRRTLLC